MKKYLFVFILVPLMTLASFTATAKHHSASNESPQVPLIFIPGFSASSPIEGEVMDFVFNRGFPPQKLQLSPSYDTLVRTLKSAGYKEGKTFFGAVYDWRMPVAPSDGNFDGILENVTAESLTSGDYSYAVNYLGYWLEKAQQANQNNLEYVDIVTHSTGGVVARAYVQSPAYGASYLDKDGNTRTLPKIRYLILGANPAFGAAHSWRPWNGDFQDVLNGFIPTLEVEGRFGAFAFLQVVLEGKQINGPDYTITRDDILGVDLSGNLIPDPTKFFRLYTPMRRSLMATYDFLLTPGSQTLTNVNSDPTVRSDVLLDLNALSSPGNNPWLTLIGAPSEGGAIATFSTGARERSSILDFLIPGLIDKNPFIETLTTVQQLNPPQGSYLPLLALLEPKPKLIPVSKSLFSRIGDIEIDEQLNGDGNGALVSLFGYFEGDPNITIVKWGNGPPPAGLPSNIVWTNDTGYPVYHDVFFFNPNVAAYVASTLTGHPVVPKSMRTEKAYQVVRNLLKPFPQFEEN